MKMGKVSLILVSLSAMCSLANVATANPAQNAASTAPAIAAPGAPVGSSAIPTIIIPDDAAAAGSAAEDTRKVCRQRDTMGTRLRAVRVCRTQAQWRVHDNQGRARAKTLTEQRPDGLRDPRMGS